jgi:pimeloyl-ACP methyl ester carboxylesterase
MEIHGAQVVYEIIGPAGGQPLVLTPGGRFSKDEPGVRPLAEKLAEGGLKVLLWDRPNCGQSEINLWGRSESHMRADTLAELLTRLEMTPAIITGGSGGARDSILTAILHPEVVRKLAVWWIVGGTYGSISLAAYYITPNISTARRLGMEGVVNLPGWAEQLRANPRNKEILLGWDTGEFVEQMLQWLDAFVPKPGQTIPGVSDLEFANIKVPTLIFRSGENDWDHPKRTSLEVHTLIKGSAMAEPPWPEDAWEVNSAANAAGTGHRFAPWVLAAPQLLDFIHEGKVINPTFAGPNA